MHTRDQMMVAAMVALYILVCDMIDQVLLTFLIIINSSNRFILQITMSIVIVNSIETNRFEFINHVHYETRYECVVYVIQSIYRLFNFCHIVMNELVVK